MNRATTYTLSFTLAVLFAAPLNAQQFGGPLAVSGDQILVGEAGNETLSGIVYVYGDTNGTWSEVEAEEFERALEIFEQVDESLWR